MSYEKALAVKSANKLRVVQRSIEQIMLGISQSDQIRNEQIRGRIKVKDIIARIMKMELGGTHCKVKGQKMNEVYRAMETKAI